jgi:hypothetical protein
VFGNMLKPIGFTLKGKFIKFGPPINGKEGILCPGTKLNEFFALGYSSSSDSSYRVLLF